MTCMEHQLGHHCIGFGIIPCRIAGLPGVLSSAGCRWDWLEATTGPVMLFHAVQAYKAVYPKAPGLNILKPGLIYPIDWRRTVWGPQRRTRCRVLQAAEEYALNALLVLV